LPPNDFDSMASTKSYVLVTGFYLLCEVRLAKDAVAPSVAVVRSGSCEVQVYGIGTLKTRRNRVVLGSDCTFSDTFR